jgi:hypothetical protein
MYANNIRGTARPQSSDLYLRENLKTQYTEQQFTTTKQLNNAFLGACQNISQRPDTYEKVRQPVIRHVYACIGSGTGQDVLRKLDKQ